MNDLVKKGVVVKQADLPEDIQRDAAEIALRLLQNNNTLPPESAQTLKKEFDRKYLPSWHCVVGKNFGSVVTHEVNHFIYFYVHQTAILLFKAGSADANSANNIKTYEQQADETAE